jgi:lysylphosphatidylglycerol synthetase-like protein (DUF2156 family)
MQPKTYKLSWFMIRHAFIGSLTWFITYFYIRRLLNPTTWQTNMDEVFIDSLFGAFAMFIMLLMNFFLFKFYECDEEPNKQNNEELLKKVSLTFTQN